jgi:hypothetical protein
MVQGLKPQWESSFMAIAATKDDATTMGGIGQI